MMKTKRSPGGVPARRGPGLYAPLFALATAVCTAGAVVPLHSSELQESSCGIAQIESPLPASDSMESVLQSRGYRPGEGAGKTLHIRLYRHPGFRLAYEAKVELRNGKTIEAKGRGISYHNAVLNALQALPECSTKK